jgi:hypothetical protein
LTFVFAGCSCGGPFPPPFSASGRIIGGQYADNHAIPYQVGLIIGNLDGFGGGTLISPNYVLSAAHSFADRNISASNVVALIGSNYLNRTDGVRIQIASILIHPLYNPLVSQLHVFVHDYSILRLSQPAPIATSGGTIGLACLPPLDGNTYIGTTLLASGWGLTSCNASFISLALKAAYLTGVPPLACNYTLRADILCALDPAATSTTGTGDSGGSLTNLKFVLSNIKTLQH